MAPPRAAIGIILGAVGTVLGAPRAILRALGKNWERSPSQYRCYWERWEGARSQQRPEPAVGGARPKGVVMQIQERPRAVIGGRESCGVCPVT